jgi:hypothetical protein
MLPLRVKTTVCVKGFTMVEFEEQLGKRSGAQNAELAPMN